MENLDIVNAFVYTDKSLYDLLTAEIYLATDNELDLVLFDKLHDKLYTELDRQLMGELTFHTDSNDN